VEYLESRRVLSGVSVMPHQMALPSVQHGHGVATVAILGGSSLDVAAIDVASLTLTATPTAGGSSQTLQLQGAPKVEDANGDGSPDLILHFARSQLKGLTGPVTIDVQGTTTVGGTTSGVTDFGSDTLTIFQPGGQHAHGPAGGQHAHGPGTQPGHNPGQVPTPGQGHGPGQIPTQGQGHGPGQTTPSGQGDGTGQLPEQAPGELPNQASSHPHGPGR
jgi:hypothetical protein